MPTTCARARTRSALSTAAARRTRLSCAISAPVAVRGQCVRAATGRRNSAPAGMSDEPTTSSTCITKGRKGCALCVSRRRAAMASLLSSLCVCSAEPSRPRTRAVERAPYLHRRGEVEIGGGCEEQRAQARRERAERGRHARGARQPRHAACSRPRQGHVSAGPTLRCDSQMHPFGLHKGDARSLPLGAAVRRQRHRFQPSAMTR
jgi:hypothetical protein